MSDNKQVAQQQQKPAVKQPTVTDTVLNRVEQLRELGEIKIPEGYEVANALKSAHLILSDMKVKVDNVEKPVLEVCTRESIYNSLFDMVVQGLSPMKKQGAFIAYNGKLQWQREYHGNIALAKRFSGMKDIVANVIYTNDKFEYSIDPATGRKQVLKHEQAIENIDENEIRGAYATIIMPDGVTNTEVMTMKQIEASWNQGYAKGNSQAHKSFRSEMCKKTVINRACKILINSSSDAGVYINDETNDPASEKSNDLIKSQANKTAMSMEIEEAKTVENETTQKPKTEPVQKELEMIPDQPAKPDF